MNTLSHLRELLRVGFQQPDTVRKIQLIAIGIVELYQLDAQIPTHDQPTFSQNHPNMTPFGQRRQWQKNR
ncbi:MAG: hypothetical protein H7835_01325 [Magnetococcus sp. XQGC-1]